MAQSLRGGEGCQFLASVCPSGRVLLPGFGRSTVAPGENLYVFPLNAFLLLLLRQKVIAFLGRQAAFTVSGEKGNLSPEKERRTIEGSCRKEEKAA